MTDRARLEQALAELSASIEWPDTDPSLPERVLAAVAAPRRRSRLRPVVAVAVVAAAVTAALVFSPAAREAAADLLRAAGIRIEFETDSAPKTGAGLELGEPTTLDAAAEEASFAVRRPGIDPPGLPDAVYADDRGAVTMAWQGGDELPAAGDSGVALLLTQSPSGPDLAYKVLGPDADVANRIVAGRPAIWIEGAAHTITMLDRDFTPIEVSTRLAANVLLWEDGGVGYRLETTADFATAKAVAESLTPVP